MHLETDRKKSNPARRIVMALFTITILPMTSYVTGENLRAAVKNTK